MIILIRFSTVTYSYNTNLMVNYPMQLRQSINFHKGYALASHTTRSSQTKNLSQRNNPYHKGYALASNTPKHQNNVHKPTTYHFVRLPYSV